jgi:cytochrome c-type biogenesis protein CcmH/NrfG
VREVRAGPGDASAWERLGRLRMRGFDRTGAREALEQARRRGPSEQGLLDLALVAHLAGDVGTEVSACEQAIELAPDSPAAWSRLAHALARTDRVTDCVAACERALALADDPEVADLREQVLDAAPRELEA